MSKKDDNIILTMTGPMERSKINTDMFILSSDNSSSLMYVYQSLLYTNTKYCYPAMNPYYIKPLKNNLSPKRLHFYNDFTKTDGFFMIDYISISNHKVLSDFLNLDFNNFDNYFIWFTKFFLSFWDFLSTSDKKKYKASEFYTFDNIYTLAQKYFEPIKKQLLEYQKTFRDFVDYTYNFNNLEKLKNLSLQQRFFVFFKSKSNKLSKIINNYSLNEYFNFQIQPGYKETDEKKLLNLFKNHEADVTNFDRIITDNIFTALYIEFYKIIQYQNEIIKRCKNCGKYFITDIKSNQLYCDNLYNDTQTCKDIGNQLAQKRKEQNEYVYGKYRKIYSKKAMLVKRNPDISSYKEDYEKWKQQAKAFMNDIRNEKKTYEDFDKWLDKNN